MLKIYLHLVIKNIGFKLSDRHHRAGIFGIVVVRLPIALSNILRWLRVKLNDVVKNLINSASISILSDCMLGVAFSVDNSKTQVNINDLFYIEVSCGAYVQLWPGRIASLPTPPSTTCYGFPPSTEPSGLSRPHGKRPHDCALMPSKTGKWVTRDLDIVTDFFCHQTASTAGAAAEAKA